MLWASFGSGTTTSSLEKVRTRVERHPMPVIAPSTPF